MITLDYIYSIKDIEKHYNREVVSVIVNGFQMISFGEEGNLSKNEANADALLSLLNKVGPYIG